MRYEIDNNNNIRCANCGSEEFVANLTGKVDVELYIRDKLIIADVEMSEFDFDEIEDIECANCGYTISPSYYYLKKQLKNNGDINA